MESLRQIESWFKQQGWEPSQFQRSSWNAYLEGASGLIQVPTGAGKTFAAVMGPIARILSDKTHNNGIRLLYITPLRALSRDLTIAIREPIEAMGWPIRVGTRNGDTTNAERMKQLKNPPQILVTTPESLCVLLGNPKVTELFENLESVILDEWHELIGSKRGTQTELALSWLRMQKPILQTWALSATIGNTDQASEHALGIRTKGKLINEAQKRSTNIKSIIPDNINGFPWAGHLGLRMYENLIEVLDVNKSTLLFTNTRNQSERWYQCLRFACPEMEEALALHHSAIDRAERECIEERMKNGQLRWVVCTSSLDLGVDFQPVERVVQIGSPKNIARLLQRAGRSAHCPGGTSQVLFMPTNALELLELSALRRGLDNDLIETRKPPHKPLDVLLQHLTTLACGPGFNPKETLIAIRGTASFKSITNEEWKWCLLFLEKGGSCLNAYSRYRKIEWNPHAERFFVREKSISRLHKLNIGTITSAPSIRVRFSRGAILGHVEENFISQLNPKDVFFFAGRQLELIRIKDMTAYVKVSTRKSKTVPAWAGGQMALSDLLTTKLRDEVELASKHILDTAELLALKPLLDRQQDLSILPKQNELLIETCVTKEGQHLFAYPFEGRFVHEGLGFLWASRFTKKQTSTITVSVNDYGFELLAPKTYPLTSHFTEILEHLLEDVNLESDLENALNLSELCKRRFRSIAQVSGLMVQGYPGKSKSSGQLQISSSLLWDVFRKHEPDNLLLKQARYEVLHDQLEMLRLKKALKRMRTGNIIHSEIQRPGPLAFPLLVERLRNRMSNESVLERITRMQNEALKHEY
ncbi:ligase-associated DNA damage response DEXH box helicase [Synechococcus sp. CC9311]|uniref:ligase-associated DNA damage response DEXH box helicase n=1 Tax=Synechococcus sp. (strain CC9311) TaxID=64471 RepID=UPI00030CB571|nr:ligase-associated DNA damage response DEXH box helicase [Synechococcus sp. CC9311]